VVLLVLILRPVANVMAYTLELRYSHSSSEALNILGIIVVLGAGTYQPLGLRTEAELKGPV